MSRRADTPSEEPQARRLFFARKALGLSQAGMAREMGVEPQTYNPWEKGGRNRFPSDDALHRLWVNQHIPPEWIKYDLPGRLSLDLVIKLVALGAMPAPPELRSPA